MEQPVHLEESYVRTRSFTHWGWNPPCVVDDWIHAFIAQKAICKVSVPCGNRHLLYKNPIHTIFPPVLIRIILHVWVYLWSVGFIHLQLEMCIWMELNQNPSQMIPLPHPYIRLIMQVRCHVFVHSFIVVFYACCSDSSSFLLSFNGEICCPGSSFFSVDNSGTSYGWRTEKINLKMSERLPLIFVAPWVLWTICPVLFDMSATQANRGSFGLGFRSLLNK